MKILGIETSCDETSAAIVEDGRKILSHVVSSSKDLHTKTGGIIPEVAAREQVKCMIPVLKESIKQFNNRAIEQSSNQKNLTVQWLNDSIANIDVIAVTIGPGLIGSLLVGVETAKTIAYVTGKPIIPVNHIFAHLYANWLHLQQPTTNNQQPSFPAIALVVSGGHTELFLMKSHKDIKWIGGTLDDAAGECFDKTARLLGLGYPGGPAIAAEAAKLCNSHPEFISGSNKMLKRVQHDIVKLPRPMIDSKDFNFSFSGLKTAVLKEVNKLKAIESRSSGIHDAVVPIKSETASKQLSNRTIEQLSYELQESITDVLVSKALKAAEKYNVKSILLGGGVAANQRLKEKFQLQLNLQPTTYLSAEALAKEDNLQLFIPKPSLCTDNAAYIASYAYFHYQPIPWQEIQAQPNLDVEV